jgi:hypothetical protein
MGGVQLSPTCGPSTLTIRKKDPAGTSKVLPSRGGTVISATRVMDSRAC